MRRREGDPEEFDALPMRRDLPTWAKITGFLGIPGFLVFYLLGVFAPLGLRSPLLGNAHSVAMSSAEQKLNGIVTQIGVHHASTVESQRVYRLICRGVWKGNADMQDNCEERR